MIAMRNEHSNISTHTTPPKGCGLHEHCQHNGQSCPEDQAPEDESRLQGGRFALASLSTFGIPAALALAGALYFSSTPGAQALGAIGGLIAGTVVARFALKVIDSEENDIT